MYKKTGKLETNRFFYDLQLSKKFQKKFRLNLNFQVREAHSWIEKFKFFPFFTRFFSNVSQVQYTNRLRLKCDYVDRPEIQITGWSFNYERFYAFNLNSDRLKVQQAKKLHKPLSRFCAFQSAELNGKKFCIVWVSEKKSLNPNTRQFQGNADICTASKRFGGKNMNWYKFARIFRSWE